MVSAPLLEPQASALRTLQALWPPEKIVLIGASAIRFFMPMRWRKTEDLDLAVAVPVKDCFARLEGLPGWVRDSRMEQRWVAPGSVRLDIIPAAPDLLEAGELIWPKSEFRMSLVGMRLAFEHSVRCPAATDLDVHVAPLHVMTVLKSISYVERPAARGRDLEDLAYLLESAVDPTDPDRYSDEMLGLGISFEEAGPRILGRRVSAVVNSAEREVLTRFSDMVLGGADAVGIADRMAVLGPPNWNQDPEEARLRIRALNQGLEE